MNFWPDTNGPLPVRLLGAGIGLLALVWTYYHLRRESQREAEDRYQQFLQRGKR